MMQIQILMQTLLLPFFVSAVGYKLLPARFVISGILLAWLASYSWMQGQFPLVPEGPVEQLWIFISLAVIGGFFIEKKSYVIFLIALYCAGLLLFSWPILAYEIKLAFVLELAGFVIAGVALVYFKTDNTRPALTSVLNFTCLGFVVAITGSLLIGQISISLAAAMGIYGIFELKNKLKIAEIKHDSLRMFGLMFLLLLFIARVYAEIDLYVTMLLVVASMVGFYSSKYATFILAAVIYLAAIVFIFINASASSYY
jgi:hypothetical protein